LVKNLNLLSFCLNFDLAKGGEASAADWRRQSQFCAWHPWLRAWHPYGLL